MPAKTLEEALRNFETALPYIPARYEAGVKKADWYTAAASDQAEKNYADAISKAVAEKRRQNAIKALSNDVWVKAAVEKGAKIISDRIRLALPKWRENFGAVYSKILDLLPRLPPKTLDWRSNITNRLMPVVETWKKASGKE